MSYTSPNVPASGLTFSQSRGGASAILEAIIAKLLVATSDAAAPTLSATGGGTTGGNLAAGTYYIKVSETNGIGETKASTEVNVTIAAGNIPQVTFAALQTGNTARSVYVGTAPGAETLYATGVTAGTLNLSAAIPTDSRASVTPPTANTTALGTKHVQAIRAVERGNLQAVWGDVARLYGEYQRGEPMSLADFRNDLRRGHTAFAALAQVCAEIGTLADANPGSFAVVTTGIGGAAKKRVWS